MSLLGAAVIGGLAAGLGFIRGSWWVGAMVFASVMAMSAVIGQAVAETFRSR